MDHYSTIAKALAYIQENRKNQPGLDEIAKHLHMSPFHFQRIFSEWAGVSPKQFLQYINVTHAKELLKKQNSILGAAYTTGLSGSGRLHDLFVKLEGMTPGEYKNGGKYLEICYSFGNSRFGDYLVASTSQGVCNLFFYEESREKALREVQAQWPQAKLTEQETPLHTNVKRFFENKLENKAVIPLHLKGTPFQLKIWEALLQIPEGQLQSYTDIATTVGKPEHRRAAGTAIAKNPVGFLIPCHRVIRSMGIVGKYRWGSTRKTAMIGWEAAQKKIPSA